MSWLKQKILPSKQQSMFPHRQRPTEWKSYKKKWALVGTQGAGKTTVADLVLMTAQTMSSRELEFSCRCLEGTSDVEEGTSLLRIGHFPAKTRPFRDSIVEAGLLMEWSNRWGTKRVHIPIVDVAGEDIQAQIKHTGGYAPNMEEMNRSLALWQDVRDADGFIMIIPASRALLFHREIQVEREAGDLPIDPDVNLKRILSAVIDYKDQSRGKSIEACACVITKWDLIMPYAAKWGMDIMDTTGQGLKSFMDICFPATSMALKSSHISNIQFFPSFVQTEIDPQTGQEKTWKTHPQTGEHDGSPMIRVKSPNQWQTYGRVPEYCAQGIRDLINFMKTFAA